MSGQAARTTGRRPAALCAALDEFLGNVGKGPTWSRLVVQYFGDQALAVLGRAR